MALIVEDGTGKADAESYTSVADADSYHTLRGNIDAWSDVDDKEVLLRSATDYMLQVYRSRWKGYRTNEVQALDWPRAWVENPDSPFAYGVAYYADDIVPVEVVNACSELALVANGGALLNNLTEGQSSVKIGPISVTYDDQGREQTKYASVDAMLKVFLILSGSSMKVVRT